MKAISLFLPLITLTSFYDEPCWAIEHRLIRCAKILSAEARQHARVLPAMSEARSKAAVEELKVFRAMYLGEFPFSPTQEAVVADDKSSARVRAAAAGRISGIIKEGLGGIGQEEDGTTIKETLGASVYEGSDDESGHEDAVLALNDRISTGRFFHQEFGSILSLHNLTPLFTHPVLWVMTGLSIFSASSGNPLGLALPIALRGHIERMVRELISSPYVLGRSEEAILLEKLNRLRSNEWVFRSFDQAMPMSVIRRVWRSGGLTAQDFQDEWLWRTYPSAMVTMTGTKLMIDPPGSGSQKEKSGWVRIDQLLRRLPGSGKIQLIVVIRLIEELPPYPRKVPSPVHAEEVGLNGGLIPIVR
jgi:hypothetical protein